MANTYTTALGLLLMEALTSLNEDVWGTNLNNAVIALLAEAAVGIDVTVSGTVTLTASQGMTNQARRAGLNLSGTGGTVNTPSGVAKPYFVRNGCSGAVSFGPDGGTHVSIPAGAMGIVTFNQAGTVAYFGSLLSASGDATAQGNKITNLADGAIGSQDAAPVAQVEALIADGASANLPAQTGHSGEYLTTDGTTPSWGALPGRTGLIPIQTQTVSSPVASVDFTTGIDGTYDEYEFHLMNVVPATDGAQLYLRTSSDGGANFDAGASDYNRGSAMAQIALTGTVGSDVSENGVSGRVHMTRPSVAQYGHFNVAVGFVNSSGAAAETGVFGFRVASADIDGVRFFFSSGNIESGIIRLYGVAK
jgi:hypothetical protein